MVTLDMPGVIKHRKRQPFVNELQHTFMYSVPLTKYDKILLHNLFLFQNVTHCITIGQSAAHLMVVFEQLVQEVHAFLSHQVGVLRVGEFAPRPSGVPPYQVFQLRVQLYPILAEVVEQLICAQDLQDAPIKHVSFLAACAQAWTSDHVATIWTIHHGFIHQTFLVCNNLEQH